jgi:TIR domain
MKVFISHSSKDKKFVRTLKDDLNENGIETWVDEDELSYGDKLVEKLEFALDYSSHFVIILSSTSVNSDWVRLELKKAFSLIGDSIKKIIPVLYRHCLIPEPLQDLLYEDLTQEVVQIEGDKVKFVSKGYSPFLKKLIETVKKNEIQLTEEDKKKLRINISEDEEIKSVEKIPDEIVSLYRTMGYLTDVGKEKVVNRIRDNSPDLKDIRPILLPSFFRYIGKEIKIGQEINFTLNYKNRTVGHFGGFRHNNIAICLDRKTRELLGVRNKYEYAVEIRIDDLHIDFVELNNIGKK